MAELGGQHVLVEHDARYPDAVPLVGGPYMNGHIPNPAIIQSVPSATSQPGNLATFSAVSAATIASEGSSGDRVSTTINYHTEDHALITQP